MACRCYWHHRARCVPCSSGQGERCATGERLWRRELVESFEDGVFLVLATAAIALAAFALGLGIDLPRFP